MHRATNWRSTCRRLPGLTPFFLTLVLCLLLKENYPFSHFPMYSTFSDRTYCVYVADGAGNPIAVQTHTYLRTSRIKKVYDGHLGRIRKELDKDKRELTARERAPAGEATLEWLYGATREELKPALDRLGRLRLYQVDVTLEKGETVEHPAEMVGEIRVPVAAAPGGRVDAAGEEVDDG